MLFGREKAIREYLSRKETEGGESPFTGVLRDYLSGTLKEKCKAIGLEKTEIHIDWRDGEKGPSGDYKCVGIQAVYKKSVAVDIQVQEENFLFCYGEDEPEQDEEYLFVGKHTSDFIYTTVESRLREIFPEGKR